MCGRFTQTRSWSELVDIYRITETDRPLNIQARYNVAPTQDVAVVRRSQGYGRELVMLRWGLVPFWAKDTKLAAKMINARADTVADKPAFRAAFKARRCLVAADGCYEWQAQGGGAKQPFHIAPEDGAPFAFAGLWETWRDKTDRDAAPLETCTLITTEAAETIAPIHDRMPVMLEADGWDVWLDPERPTQDLVGMLAPYANDLRPTLVSTRVNSVKNDDEMCFAPVAADRSLRADPFSSLRQ